MRRTPSRFLTALAASGLFVAGCSDGSGSDAQTSSTRVPDPWAEIEVNFLAGCAENPDPSQTTAESSVDAYCRCAFSETVEYYGTVEAFIEAEQPLADDVEAIDPRLAAAFAGCAELHLG